MPLPTRRIQEHAVLIGGAPGVHEVWLWHNVLIIAWRDRATAHAARALTATTGEVLAQRRFDKLSYIHMILNKLELPDSQVRTALVDSTKQYHMHMGCSAVIVSGGGFWASAIRSFITGIRVLTPRSMELRIHGSIAELESWFCTVHAEKTGIELDSDALTLVLQKIQTGDEPAQPDLSRQSAGRRR
jgi:hypothetical protein